MFWLLGCNIIERLFFFFKREYRVCSFVYTAARHHSTDFGLVTVGTNERLVTELNKGLAFG